MSDRHSDGDRAGRGSEPDDPALADRLRRLSERLEVERPKPVAEPGRPSSSSEGWAKAMRLSSEFIGGIVVGGGLGWMIDRVFGISPFGLIIFLLLGFAAGVLNVLRASGALPGARHNPRDPTSGS